MQYPYANPEVFRRQRWQEVWPTPLLAIIAISQMLLTFLIVGFETWSVILSMKYSFVSVGYQTAFFFTITWISTFTVVCCNRGSRGCATHAVVENSLSIIASIVLLYYDALFLRNPYTCFWPSVICFDFGIDQSLSTWWNIIDSDIYNAKLIAIKLQLSCAAIMLFLSVMFIVIYIYTSLKVAAKSQHIHPQVTMEMSHQQTPLPLIYPVSSY